MSKRAPMHLNPRHPMWWGLPLAVACLLLLFTAGFVAFALQGDTQAWPGAVMVGLVTLFIAWTSYRMWKDAHER